MSVTSDSLPEGSTSLQLQEPSRSLVSNRRGAYHILGFLKGIRFALSTGALENGMHPNRSVRYGGVGLVVVVSIGIFLAWIRPPQLHGVPLQSPERAADFTLMSTRGSLESLSDFRGKYVLLYFGYSYCPDVCPTTLNDLTVALETLASLADDVQVLMVTVDPDRDSVDHLSRYLSNFHPEFLGMTGSRDEIDLAASRYGIFFDVAEGSEATGYLVDHTSIVTLVDADGYVREVFPYGVTGEEIAADLRYWMQ